MLLASYILVTRAKLTGNLVLFYVTVCAWLQKRDSEILQADDVRDSLLEITRNSSKAYWPEMAKTSGNDSALDYDHDHHHYHHHLHNYHSPPYHLQHLYN